MIRRVKDFLICNHLYFSELYVKFRTLTLRTLVIKSTKGRKLSFTAFFALKHYQK